MDVLEEGNQRQRQNTVKMATVVRLSLVERLVFVNDTKYICPST